MPTIPVQHYSTMSPAEFELKVKWWEQPEENICRHVFGIIKRVISNQNYRQIMNLRHARLYANMEIMGLQAGQFARASSADNYMTNRVTLNVVKSCIDSVTSKIAKTRPRPLFLTMDGNATMQFKAKKLTKYLDGWFDAADVYDHGAQAFRDGCIFGFGALKMFIDNDKKQVRLERTLPDEIIVDEAEGRYGHPRQLHQKRDVPREKLLDMFPKFEQQIRAAHVDYNQTTYAMSTADVVEVVESWHLPTSSTAKDGLHTICIENCTLFSEPWEKEYFPFVFFRWLPRIVGFYGQGLAEELLGIQLEINKILRTIQLAQHLMGVPRFLIENSSKVVSTHLNNDVGAIVKYTGTPPQVMTAGAMAPEIYSHLENLYRKAYEITGISMMSAQSQKPSGVTAAVAMREISDIETERFAVIAQAWEKFYMDIAKMAIDFTRDLAEEVPDLTVKAKGGKFISSIKWKDVDLEDDQYIMRVFPTNMLPTKPEGKLQTVQELIQAGFLSKEEGMELLDFPDTERFFSLKNSSIENILLMIEKMVDEGEYVAPEPYMNLKMAKDLAQSAYLKYKNQNAPDDRLELLRRFIDMCQEQLGVAAAAMQPPPGAPPIATPQAAPQSELLPFTTPGAQAPVMGGM